MVPCSTSVCCRVASSGCWADGCRSAGCNISVFLHLLWPGIGGLHIPLQPGQPWLLPPAKTLLPFSQQVLGLTHKWAGLFVALGSVSAVATVMKTVTFSLAGEQLTYRLRSLTLSRTLRHPMSWFDQPLSSPSSLAAMLASDAPLVQGVS